MTKKITIYFSAQHLEDTHEAIAEYDYVTSWKMPDAKLVLEPTSNLLSIACLEKLFKEGFTLKGGVFIKG